MGRFRAAIALILEDPVRITPHFPLSIIPTSIKTLPVIQCSMDRWDICLTLDRTHLLHIRHLNEVTCLQWAVDSMVATQLEVSCNTPTHSKGNFCDQALLQVSDVTTCQSVGKKVDCCYSG